MEKTSRFGAHKPEDFIIKLVDASGNEVNYMTNQGRIIAFRNEYPDGKIRTEEKYYSEQSLFVVTAYIYANKNDAPDQYLACDFGSRVFRDNNSLPEAATQAISRALGRCGFGTVYSSPDEGFNGDISEAGVIPHSLVQDVVTKSNTETTTVTAAAEVKPRRGRRPKGETPVVSEEVKPMSTERAIEPPVEDKEIKAEVEDVKKVEEATEELTPETAPIPPAEPESVIEASEKTASVNLKNMTLEEAKRVKIPFGQKKGQFMGEVFVTDPNAVRWYAEKYSGDNEEVKKSAQIILASLKK